MSERYVPMNSDYRTGVVDLTIDRWVVEPEYTWKVARIMADCLNEDPNLDPDELTRIVLEEK
jgi:hypothetical protein